MVLDGSWWFVVVLDGDGSWWFLTILDGSW